MTPLSQEEVDALRVVLPDNGIGPGELSLENSQSTLEKVQQLLTEIGYRELATNIRAKINKGKYITACTGCITALIIYAC